MKKNIFLCALLTTIFSYSYAQTKSTTVRLNVYGNYVFDDKVDNGYSYSQLGYFSGTIKGGFLWGGGLEFRLHDYYGLELLYNRLDTHVPLDYYSTVQDQKTRVDLGINYIMLAGTRSL